MAWERFQYLCRAGLAKPDNNPLSDYIDSLDAKDSANLYGKLPKNSLPMSLLQGTKALDEPQARLALKTYANLDPTFLVEKPHATKRLPIYLLWVGAVYILSVLVYKFRIFPMFESAAENAVFAIPAETQFFIDYGPIFALLLGLLILLLVSAVLGLNRLASFKRDHSQSTFLEYLCPGFLKKPYLRLIGILHYPILDKKMNNDLVVEYNTHFDQVVRSNMALDEEICALFKAEDRKLIRRIEIVAKTISVFIALIVFYSVYKFVYGFYLPFFYYGATL